MVDNVRRTFPQLAKLEIDHAWGAYVDCTPDAIPVISPVRACDGLYLAAGCSGHGFGLGPGIGKVVSQLVRNDPPDIAMGALSAGPFDRWLKDRGRLAVTARVLYPICPCPEQDR